MSSQHVRSRWAAGRPARLAWATMADPQLVDLAASTGHFDAVVLDMQHGTFDRIEVADTVRVLGRWPVSVLVRIASADPDLIGWVLDAGVDGVIVAMCESATDAERIVSSVRYAPDGRRSVGVFRVHAAGHDALAAANEAIVLPMVESADGLANAAAIASVPGVDGLFIGPGDLGQSLGHGLGQNRTEPAMLDAFARVRAAARQAGGRCGIFAVSADYARQCADEGYDLVVPWVDVTAITAALATTRVP